MQAVLILVSCWASCSGTFYLISVLVLLLTFLLLQVHKCRSYFGTGRILRSTIDWYYHSANVLHDQLSLQPSKHHSELWT